MLLLIALLFVSGCQSNANSPVSNPDNSVTSDASAPESAPVSEPEPPVSPEPVSAVPSPVLESTTEKTPQPSEPAPASTVQSTQPQPQPQPQQATQPSQNTTRTTVIEIELSPKINSGEVDAAYKRALAEQKIDDEMKAKYGNVEVVGDGTNGTNNGDGITVKNGADNGETNGIIIKEKGPIE